MLAFVQQNVKMYDHGQESIKVRHSTGEIWSHLS